MINLSKEQTIIQLEKRQKTVESICLTKNPLKGLTARVALAIDVSGSMYKWISNGYVQLVIERILPLAMQFDDNGEMELWTFNDKFKRQPTINLQNVYNYIKDQNITSGGSTNYAPVLADVLQKFVQEEPSTLPTYLIFITDGDNFDKGETNKIIKLMSKFPIFIQFIGIGDEDFKYLRKLDNLRGRNVDNANFAKINDLYNSKRVSDEALYKRLLAEYPQWLSIPKVKQMLSKPAELSKSDSKKVKKLLSHDDSLLSEGTIDLLSDILELVIDAFT